MRVAYFGPEGTFTHEALIDALGTVGDDDEAELVPFSTIYETVMAIQFGDADRALVPIENSLEGSVNATLDTLAMEAPDVAIVGEVVHPIHHCLVARTKLELDEVEAVVSHPQATAQCAGFIRTRLPNARVLAGSSTADAVRMVAAHEGPWAALGNRLAAERYGCRILRIGVEDGPDNETRFVWLAPGRGGPGGVPGAPEDDPEAAERGPDVGEGGPDAAGDRPSPAGDRPSPASPAWKTSIVFWGVGSDAPGWLVSCLAEFADRGVNLTRIESRPRKQGLGRYMFFLDLEGQDLEPRVAGALEGLSRHVEVLRVLGSFPAAELR